jgi:hypothetical protein
MTYGIGNPGPGFGQVQKCIEDKPVNGIPTLLLLLDLQWQYKHKHIINSQHIFASSHYHKYEYEQKIYQFRLCSSKYNYIYY